VIVSYIEDVMSFQWTNSHYWIGPISILTILFRVDSILNCYLEYLSHSKPWALHGAGARSWHLKEFEKHWTIHSRNYNLITLIFIWYNNDLSDNIVLFIPLALVVFLTINHEISCSNNSTKDSACYEQRMRWCARIIYANDLWFPWILTKMHPGWRNDKILETWKKNEIHVMVHSTLIEEL